MEEIDVEIRMYGGKYTNCDSIANNNRAKQRFVIFHIKRFVRPKVIYIKAHPVTIR